MIEIRRLKADEIDIRVGQVFNGGCRLLLYKDARCDMNILDEVYGVLGWQRTHDVVNGNLFCTVSIWDAEKKEWVHKQDVGTESNTEKEKGEASDSFKRACVNLGIGRELYTPLDIRLKCETVEKDVAGKKKYELKNPYVKYEVRSIEYNDKREIIVIVIVDENGKTVFEKKVNSKGIAPKQEPTPTTQEATPKIDPPQEDKLKFNRAEAIEQMLAGLQTRTDSDKVDIDFILAHYKRSEIKFLSNEQIAETIASNEKHKL